MTQTFQLPVAPGTDSAAQAISVLLPTCLESLRSNFSGATAPSSPAPVEGQLWADTATGYLKVRNGSSAWVIVARLSASLVLQLAAEGWATNLAASKTDWLGSVPRAGTIKRIVLTTSSASTSSSGNEWQFQVRKYPNSAPGSPVNLFSGTVGTFTALGGVGGGAETVANAAYVLTPNQNAAVLDLDQLDLVVTKVGTATTLNAFRARVEME